MESNETEAFTDVLKPNILITNGALINPIISFDYDYTGKFVHFIDGVPNNYSLNSKELLPNKHQYELDKYDYNNPDPYYKKVTSLSYDWVSENIYVFYELVEKDDSHLNSYSNLL